MPCVRSKLKVRELDPKHPKQQQEGNTKQHQERDARSIKQQKAIETKSPDSPLVKEGSNETGSNGSMLSSMASRGVRDVMPSARGSKGGRLSPSKGGRLSPRAQAKTPQGNLESVNNNVEDILDDKWPEPSR